MDHATIYARVSTTAQKEFGRGLQAQLERCQEYAKKQGYVIRATYQDDISGITPLNEREQGAALWQLTPGSHLILDALDRLMRPPEDEYYRLSEVVSQLQKGGVVVHTVEDGIVGTDMTSHVLVFFKGVVAAEERMKIARRMHGGRLHKAANQWVGAGFGPYGYRATGHKKNRQLQINGMKADIVRRIFDEYAYQNTTLRGLCNKLIEEGIPSPKGGKNWWPRTLYEILQNRTYIGEVSFAGVVHKDESLRIIDDHTFDLVQKRLESNRLQSGMKSKTAVFPLSSRLHCECGGMMSGISQLGKGKRFRYYRCNKYKRVVDQCKSKVSANKLDDACWKWLRGILARPEAFAASLDDLRDTGQAEKLARQEEATKKEIKHLERKLQSLVGQKAEALNRHVAEAVNREIEKTAAALEYAYQVAQNLAAEQAAGVSEDDISFYWDLFHRLGAVMDHADDTTRKEVFFLADLQVTKLGQGDWQLHAVNLQIEDVITLD